MLCFFAILGTVFLLSAWACSGAAVKKLGTKRTCGTIHRIAGHNGGNVIFCVRFYEAGEERLGRSVRYADPKGRYRVGDRVEILYRERRGKTRKGGIPLVLLCDDVLVPRRDFLSNPAASMLGMGIGCFLVSFIFLLT